MLMHPPSGSINGTRPLVEWQQRILLSSFAQLVSPGEQCVLLFNPAHANAGDSVIALATFVLAEKLGVNITAMVSRTVRTKIVLHAYMYS